MGGVVLEDHADGVPYFGAQDGPENSGMLPLWRARFQSRERIVGVFTVDGFTIDGSDAMRTLFDIDVGITRELHAHHFVDAAGSVVPFHLVGGDVVGADLAGSCSGLCPATRCDRENQNCQANCGLAQAVDEMAHVLLLCVREFCVQEADNTNTEWIPVAGQTEKNRALLTDSARNT